MSKSEKAVPYLREVAGLLNEYRSYGEVEIQPDGGIWDAKRRCGLSDETLKEEMVALRNQLQSAIEKMDWLLSLWNQAPVA